MHNHSHSRRETHKLPDREPESQNTRSERSVATSPTAGKEKIATSCMNGSKQDATSRSGATNKVVLTCTRKTSRTSEQSG